MPGEQSRQGWNNTKLFASLVERFGWTLRGPIDKNIDCTKCTPTKKGEPKVHGVDAIFTFDCPYSGTTRGILVDGKRYAFNSVGGPKKVEEWLASAYETTSHARESMASLREQRGLPHDTKLDTFAVVWDCFEGWDTKKARDWLRSVKFGGRPEQPMLGLVSTRTDLDRLQTLAAFRDKVLELQFFYYSPGTYISRSEVATPELLHSPIQAIHYRLASSEPSHVGALFSDTDDPPRIRLLPRFLNHIGLMSHEKIDVFIMCREGEVEVFESHLSAEVKTSLGRSEMAKFEVHRLARVPFES